MEFEKLIKEKLDTIGVSEGVYDIFDTLFEVTASNRGLEAEDVPMDKNKIKKEKKTKDGTKEIVSVEDELFPYEGNAKQQYNQKIVAKINDMIEGKATLEDLINLVRQKKATSASESLAEAIKLVEEMIKK